LHVSSPENWDSSRLKQMMKMPEPPTGEKALVELEKSDVDMAVLVSTAYMFPDRAMSMHENDYVAGLVKAHPDKFLGLCGVQPSQPWAMEEIDRCINQLGLHGLKLHLYATPLDLTDEEDAAILAAVFKKAAEVKKGLPVLMDFNWMDDAQTAALMVMAMSNPDVNIVMAHGLGHHYKEYVNVALFRKMMPGGLNNLYADISATLSTYPPDAPAFADYIWHLRQMGAGHLLFGSDYPVETADSAYGHFLQLGFSPDEQQQIRGNNAARLYGCTQAAAE
ncbi:MAG TPA: amidohydrolase family protein, partial [Xanthomonadales bacterium]|nr:amidohydrolase family protein [Xanthomonadales bacterium]